MIGRFMVEKVGIPYWISIERVKMKKFRGHRVPLTIYLRLQYKTGSHILFYLVGSSVSDWAKGL